MRTLKDLLPLKKIFPIPTAVDEKTIFFVCRKVLIEEYGVRGGENIIPSFYQDKKLFLSPRSSLWGSEVWLSRKQIVAKINALLGCQAVSEIKISQQQ